MNTPRFQEAHRGPERKQGCLRLRSFASLPELVKPNDFHTGASVRRAQQNFSESKLLTLSLPFSLNGRCSGVRVQNKVEVKATDSTGFL